MAEKVRFRDFKIIPDFNSVRKEEIDDATYFSPQYSNYISNSGLKWIDPKSGGSPQLFKNHPKLKSQSLVIGSAVHEIVLQPESFELAPKLGKPGAKLGEVLDEIPKFLEDGIGLDDAIKQAALKVDYYSSSIDSKIETIKEEYNKYQAALANLGAPPEGKEWVILSDKDWDVANACIESCKNNDDITNLLHPVDPFGDPAGESYCEDAFFMDYIVIYKEKQCATLHFKMKADNWTIDFDNKVVTLNDLKTTGKSVNIFMSEEGSFNHFDYARQMFVYGEILWYYCMNQYGISKKQGWKLKSNMLVVETIPNNWSRSYYVTAKQLQEGRRMLRECLCRVAYCEIFGYDKEIEFV